ncbi:MAG: Trk system potassium transporter TrkA [Parvibaculales bacterium]
MKVIVCGAGQFGFGIARHLAGEGDDVTVVDRMPELMQHIANTLDVRPVLGHCGHPQVLDDAGAADADIVIAVTASDEVNMVACQVAKSLFNVPKTIARVRDHHYRTNTYEKLFSDNVIPVDVVISPETEVAQAVGRRITLPGAFDSATFCNGQAEMVGISIHENCPITDTPLHQLTDLFPDLSTVVVGINRDGKVYVPDFDDTMQLGDEAFVVTASSNTERTLKIFGHEENEVRKILIVGGGNVGSQLARQLDKQKGRYTLTLLEHDKERAKKVADALPHTIVLHGSGLSPESLSEARVRDADLIAGLTNDNQVNVLTTMLALQEGCKRGVCLINDSSFLSLTRQIGMDVAINPRAVTVSSVLGHVRQGKVVRVHTVVDGAAEIIEAQVPENSPLIGTTLRDLKLPQGLRIGAIWQNNELTTPRGDSEVKAGDYVVIFATRESIEHAEHLFN